MENNSNLGSGYTIDKILLLKSYFSRLPQVDFSDKVKNTLNVKVDVEVNDKTVTVREAVKVIHEFENVNQITIEVEMVGIFMEIEGNKKMSIDAFGNVNGAAMIFPYIREHISNLSVKAGIGAILLPPVNFEKRWNDITKKEELTANSEEL